MDNWELATKIETISYRIESANCIIELVATNISEETNSGALWSAYDSIKTYIEQLNILSSEIMELHKSEKKLANLKKEIDDIDDGRC